MVFFFSSSTAMKVTHRPLDITRPPVVDRVEVVMGAVEVRQVDTVAAGVTNNHPNMEEVTTTRLQATTPLLHRATVSRASMVKAEVRKKFTLTPYNIYVYVFCGFHPVCKEVQLCREQR